MGDDFYPIAIIALASLSTYKSGRTLYGLGIKFGNHCYDCFHLQSGHSTERQAMNYKLDFTFNEPERTLLILI